MINLALYDEGFTQSELSQFSSCPQKWFYRYNLLLAKRGTFSFPLLIGSAFHTALETWYATQGKTCNVATLVFPIGVIPSSVEIQKLEYWNHLLPVMVRAYVNHYKKDFDNLTIVSFEEEIDIMYRGIRLRGKIDLTVQERSTPCVMDHKTAASIGKNTIAGWDFRFQFMFYVWLKWKLTGKLHHFIINATKKTQLRVKKDESIPEFAERVFQDMIYKTDEYFYRDTSPVTKESITHFEKEVLDPKIDRLLFIRELAEKDNTQILRALVLDKNTDECQRLGFSPCAFIDLCRHGNKMLFQYDKQTTKHQELKELNADTND